MSPSPQLIPPPELLRKPVEAVVLGASAGGVQALTSILPELPADYPLPLMVVIHLPPERESILVGVLQARCRLRVKEAEDKEPIRPGTVYLAPPAYHLLVEPERRLSLSSDDPVLFCRPAVDVLFESAADAYGPTLIGIVLTGANTDGARGLAAVGKAGGIGVVQDPALAPAPLMPQSALAACPGARAMSLEQITALLRAAAVQSEHVE